jgi:hypothetical protein
VIEKPLTPNRRDHASHAFKAVCDRDATKRLRHTKNLKSAINPRLYSFIHLHHHHHQQLFFTPFLSSNNIPNGQFRLPCGTKVSGPGNSMRKRMESNLEIFLKKLCYRLYNSSKFYGEKNKNIK